MDKQAERWREKYLQLLEQSQQAESRQQEERDHWQRTLVMLSLLAEGQDPRLDPALSALRHAVRHSDQLPDTQPLEIGISDFESRHEAARQRLLEALQQSASELLALDLPAEHRSRLKALRKQARQQLANWIDAQNLMTEWLGLIPGGDTWASPRPGWLSRWFGQSSASSTVDAVKPGEPTPVNALAGETSDSDIGPELSQQGTAALEARDGPPCDTSVPTPTAVGQGLLKLLEQLNLPEPLQPQAEMIRQQLADKPTIDSMLNALEQLAELLIASLNASQSALEKFLLQLDQQLHTLHQHLGDECFEASAGQRARQSLNSEVQQQVSGLQAVVRSQSDINQLGERIQSHLMAILGAMERFDEQEQAREVQQQQQLAGLRQRLADVEQQATATRQALSHQQQLAYRDALTGLPNRHAYSSRIRKLWRQSMQDGDVLLAVVDVDFFKRINDQYGHQAGDRVLKLIAKTLRKALPENHFLARYGGEEFVMLLQKLTLEQAQTLCNELREAVAAVPYHFKGEPVTITVSLGLSAVRQGERPEAVFERADQALYQAKQNGRNRVECG